ncbi:MAG: hypothetical protein IH933_12350, partial [Euryarchaeota archaeon]|nr:hypothetical protein [Euryarchaeota archaeon]
MIRTAGEKDIERIRTVVQRSWMETYADSLGADTVRDHVTDEEFYTPTELRNRLRDTDGVVLVAETDEAGIVGYTYLSWNSNAGYIDEHEADLRHIYLHPDHYG